MATKKQRDTFREVLNGTSIKKAMIKAKYAVSTSKSTGKVTRTKGWQELLLKYLPDEELLKVHKEGLSAGKKIFKNNNESGEIELVGEEPDYAVRHKYLDTGYKVKGKLVDKVDISLIGRKSIDKLQEKETNRIMGVFDDNTTKDTSSKGISRNSEDNSL